ncbi:enoyl-CoA hydratase/isomerase family protein [Aquabacterium sp. A7-Y]|uniref:enoyl-CoA hydratase/isomerase family protein n=1 Tax=Aquabacterium sp. A7-Y TaxID=1349605 RepID=UPI00223DB94E|nr:enoyl-CoA hydratase/isomerase family protein [Aquabacterium sp. A7-Y]MCW7540950.1 enoyl-CoA hydratase/isomerase family protein [Aquabacterium sp. A7-Y]
MTATLQLDHSDGLVRAHKAGDLGFITLNRPEALNALSLAMIRDLTQALLAWRDDPTVRAVVVQGATREGKGVAFCAGGDIRFFHGAALQGNPQVDDFFTEEYSLNHLIHVYPKPYIALMDGIVMGGGMGISQGAKLRIVTERTKMAMPETNIGLFPDVGGGFFLSRCPGHVGEYLALTGQVIGAGDALAWGLADAYLHSGELPGLVEALAGQPHENGEQVLATLRARMVALPQPALVAQREAMDRHFSADGLKGILDSLAGDADPWAAETLAVLRKRSPLMMAVTLEQIRRARRMNLADDLRMERDLVRHCFALRPGAASETVEGIRALVIDKDHSPRWNPATVEEVTPEMVQAFFRSPWPAFAHPLRALG